MRSIRLEGPRGLVLEVGVPTSHAERMRGLLGRDSLGEREALLLERTRSIHTFGMRFPIGVVLLDRSSKVLAVRRVAPGHLVLPRLRVRHVLECATDTDVRVGDQLSVLMGTSVWSSNDRVSTAGATGRRATRRSIPRPGA